MTVDTKDGRNAVRSGDEHTGPQPTHETVADKMQQDDLATREAELTKARGNASAHDITGQRTPDTVKSR